VFNIKSTKSSVGWIERSETQHINVSVGFRSSTQPTTYN